MRDSITSAVASMKCIKLDGQARCQPIMAWRVQIFDNVWLVQSFGDPNVIIGCLPPEVLAPSPGTKSLDVNSVLRGCTSKFLVEDVPTHKGLTVHTCILKKTRVFSPYPGYFLLFTGTRKPQKIYSHHAQLGSGQRLRAARRNRKLKGSKSWICPSPFQPSRGGQCAVLVVLLMSRLTVGTTKMMNVWYVWKWYRYPWGRCTFPILLCWSTSPPSELLNRWMWSFEF